MLIYTLKIFSYLTQILACYCLIVTLGQIFLQKTIDKNQKLIIFLILSLGISSSLPLHIYFPLNTIVSFLSFTLCALLVMKLPFIKSIFISVTILLTAAIVEIIIVYLFSFIFNLYPNDVINSPIKQALLIIVHSFILFILCQFLKIKFLKDNKVKNFFSELTHSQNKLFLICIIFCVFPQIFIFAFNKYEYSMTFLITNCIQIIIICIFIIIFVKRNSEKDKIQRELTISELHNKTMINMVDSVRVLKHDFNNIMQAFNGYIATKQYDKLEEHLNKILAECSYINTLSIITPELINDPALYGIIGAKYFLAIEKDIKFDLDIATSIKDIRFCTADLSRIIGILLDNAIEATQNLKEKYIKLEIRFDFRKCADIINIKNTFDTSKKIDISSIFKKGFSTKEIKSGIGLWEVNRLINRADNSQIISEIDGKYFKQKIIIER